MTKLNAVRRTLIVNEFEKSSLVSFRSFSIIIKKFCNVNVKNTNYKTAIQYMKFTQKHAILSVFI